MDEAGEKATTKAAKEEEVHPWQEGKIGLKHLWIWVSNGQMDGSSIGTEREEKMDADDGGLQIWGQADESASLRQFTFVSSEAWGKETEKAASGFEEKGSVRELSWDGKARWLEKSSRIVGDSGKTT